MKTVLWRLRDELGVSGILSLAVLIAAAMLYFTLVQPMQVQHGDLRARLEKQARTAPSAEPSSTSDKLGAFYRFMEKPEQTTDWLAKLYAIGQATGVGLQSAAYKSHPGSGRLERYEIVLPVTGSYTQIREFLKRSLAEIPVLSLDQLSLKREARTDGSVNAELRLTLHTLKP
ncbi:MAG: GspMb/PilO family protein [Betaproteobacteria bacterium]